MFTPSTGPEEVRCPPNEATSKNRGRADRWRQRTWPVTPHGSNSGRPSDRAAQRGRLSSPCTELPGPVPAGSGALFFQ